MKQFYFVIDTLGLLCQIRSLNFCRRKRLSKFWSNEHPKGDWENWSFRKTRQTQFVPFCNRTGSFERYSNGIPELAIDNQSNQLPSIRILIQFEDNIGLRVVSNVRRSSRMSSLIYFNVAYGCQHHVQNSYKPKKTSHICVFPVTFLNLRLSFSFVTDIKYTYLQLSNQLCFWQYNTFRNIDVQSNRKLTLHLDAQWTNHVQTKVFQITSTCMMATCF